MPCLSGYNRVDQVLTKYLLLFFCIGIFIKGPIKNIDTNINTVVDSFTCMYEEMEKLAKKYMDNATAWADEMKHVLSEQTRFFREKLREMVCNYN